MASHSAKIRWKHSGPSFVRGQFSRDHTWTFDGGAVIPASASPAVVPGALASHSHVDPEEAFVAAIASCHMLTFLHVAAHRGFQVESYEDEPVGVTTRDDQGRTSISIVSLHPRIVYAGDKQPTEAELSLLHHLAHDQCFIANSLKTAVSVN